MLLFFFAADFSDLVYQKKTMNKVVGLWKVPAETPEHGGKTVVIVTILKSGEASEPRLHHKSGSDSWDASAVAAVEQASPFDPLPKSYAPGVVEVHFHFEYTK